MNLAPYTLQPEPRRSLFGQARSPNERGGGRGVGLGVTDAMVDRSAGGGGRAPGGDEEVTCLLLCKGATRTADPWRGRRRSLPGSTLLGAGKLSGGQGAPGGSMLRRRAMEDGAADAGSADEDATKGRGEVTEGSVFGAALLFAGTAIGAGMLALPAGGALSLPEASPYSGSRRHLFQLVYAPPLRDA